MMCLNILFLANALVSFFLGDLKFISLACGLLLFSFFKTKSRVIFVSTLFMYLYCFFPWFFALLGGIYFDLSLSQIENGVLYSAKLLLILFILILMLSLFWSGKTEKDYFDELFHKMSNVSQSTLYTLRIISLCIAVITLGQFFLYGSFNNLRLNKEILSFAENQYYQIVFIPIALLLLSKVLTNKSRVDIIFLVFSISPFLLSGSRKELFILFCSLFFVYRKSIGGKSLICMSLFIAFMLILPLFREGAGVYDVFVSFHEFILPQYGFFLYYESATSLHFGGSDLISGVWSLLPGVLRLSEFITIGNALSQYGLANNIGLASNPALEAHINFGDVGYLIFPFIIFSYFLLCRLIVTKKIIFLSPFLFYLIVLGRSDVWLTVFFALYTSVFMFLAIKRFKNR